MLLLDIIKIKGMEKHAAFYIGSRRKETINVSELVCFFQMCVMCVKHKVCLYRLTGCSYVCMYVYAKSASDQLFSCN